MGALIIAGNYNIPEVGVYFRWNKFAPFLFFDFFKLLFFPRKHRHQLLRGNRTVKVSSGDLDAFHSPNMSPLVKAGEWHKNRAGIFF